MPSRPFVAPAVVVTLAAAMLAGCSSKPENSPAIRKKFSEIDELTKTVAETNRNMKTSLAEMKVLQDQMNDLKALTPDENGVLEVVNRLESMEKRLAAVEGGVAPTFVKSSTPAATDKADGENKEVASVSTTSLGSKEEPMALAGSTSPKKNAEVASADTPAEPRKDSKPAKTDKPAKAEKKASSKKGTEVALASEKSVGPRKPATTTPVVSSGKYIMTRDGDSLQKIALDAGISVEALRKANSLPPTAHIGKGQHLFVPTK